MLQYVYCVKIIVHLFQNIVEQLIENSATFSEKTGFAQEKYIKKKKKK